MIARRSLLLGGFVMASSPSKGEKATGSEGIFNFLNKGKTVITGHLGNIGSRLFQVYSDRGGSVVGVDKKDGIEFDLGFSQGTASLHGAGLVMHLAAYAGIDGNRADYEHDNMRATRNVVDACIRYKIPRLVFASSTWVDPVCYGRPRSPAYPDYIPYYGVTKKYGEWLMQKFSEGGHNTAVAIRIGWAPTPGTSTADPYSESIRNETSALVEAFDAALFKAPGYHLIELAKRTGKCT